MLNLMQNDHIVCENIKIIRNPNGCDIVCSQFILEKGTPLVSDAVLHIDDNGKIIDLEPEQIHDIIIDKGKIIIQYKGILNG